MPTIIFIRHGENNYTRNKRLAGRLPGVHLNKHGKAQAKSLADRLKYISIKAIYCSPLERTVETAQPIAEALNVEIIYSNNLLEVDFGEWQGKTLSSIQKQYLWKYVQNSPSMTRFPNGESFLDAQNRVIKQIEEINDKYAPEDNILCISHCDIIKLAIAFCIGMPVDCFQRLYISTGSLNVLKIVDGHSSLITLNFDPTCSIFTPPLK